MKGVKGEKKNLSPSTFVSLQCLLFGVFRLMLPCVGVGGPPGSSYQGGGGTAAGRAETAAGTGYAPFIFVTAAINSACLS